MWKRIRRNKFGSIESATSSEQYPFSATEVRPGDTIQPDGWAGNNVSVKYAVYSQTEEQYQHENGDWWEDHYDSYETDSLGLAVRELMFRLFGTRETKTDIKFFMEIDGKEAHGETWMEIPWDVIRPVREMVKEGTNKEIDRLEREVEALTEATREYEDFLKSVPGGMEMFRKWKQERSR